MNRVEVSDPPMCCSSGVCGHANENCPFFPAPTRVMHIGFGDPPRLAESAQTKEEALAHYRRVRDEIRAFVEQLPETMNCSGEQRKGV